MSIFSAQMQAELYDYDNVTVNMAAGLASPQRSFDAAMRVVRHLVQWTPPPPEDGHER